MKNAGFDESKVFVDGFDEKNNYVHSFGTDEDDEGWQAQVEDEDFFSAYIVAYKR